MKGFPLVFARGAGGIVLQRVIAPVLIVAALSASVAALHVAVSGRALAGVGSDPTGTVVTHVLPGGGAWRHGIRTGQDILSIEPGERPEDWRLVTSASGHSIHAGQQGMTIELRDTASTAALALVAATLAVLLLPLGRRGASAMAVLALVLAQHPFLMAGDELPSALAAIWALAVPTAWLAVWHPTTKRPFLPWAIGAALVVALLWVLARLSVAGIYDPVDSARIWLAYSLVAAIGVGITRDARWTGGYDLRQRADLAAIAVVLGGSVIALLLSGVPLETVAITAIVVLAAYPIVRGRVRADVSRLFLGGLRERAAIAATEEARGRLARDLHDEPLQAIAAVIRGIDAHPPLASEATALRDVAAQLRAMTGELRSPVLDDLGLAAAIAFLVDQTAPGTDIEIVSGVATGVPLEAAARPPGDVEIALFRIVQEALHNAVEHSAAERIVVAGHIDRDEVELFVSDDGVGIDQETLRRAEAAGRLGLRSMRQRAALIDAELRIASVDPGTRVSLRWRR